MFRSIHRTLARTDVTSHGLASRRPTTECAPATVSRARATPSHHPYHALSLSSRARRRAAFIKCYTLDRILERNAGTFCIMARNSCVLAGTLFPLIKQLRYYVVYATIFIPAALRQHYLYMARGNMRGSG